MYVLVSALSYVKGSVLFKLLGGYFYKKIMEKTKKLVSRPFSVFREKRGVFFGKRNLLKYQPPVYTVFLAAFSDGTQVLKVPNCS